MAELIGQVSSGLGQGRYFTRLDWVVEQFSQKLGIDPYPGTFNVNLNPAQLQPLVNQDLAYVDIIPPDPAFCPARCYRVRINHLVEGAVVVAEATSHPANYIEIIAAVNIKETLGVQDGDDVAVEFY